MKKSSLLLAVLMAASVTLGACAKKETTYKHFTSSILLYKSRIIKMLKLILKKVVLGMEKHLPDWLQSS